VTPPPQPLDLLLDSLAVHRATRLVTTDTITAPLRERVWRSRPPESSPLGYVLSCDYCASIYLAAAVAATHAPRLRFLRPVVYILAAADFTAIMSDRSNTGTNTNWS
jgi:hypothetical protein